MVLALYLGQRIPEEIQEDAVGRQHMAFEIEFDHRLDLVQRRQPRALLRRVPP